MPDNESELMNQLVLDETYGIKPIYYDNNSKLFENFKNTILKWQKEIDQPTLVDSEDYSEASTV